jgi:hypothetical protein
MTTSKSFKDYLDDNDYQPSLKSKSKSIEYLEDMDVKDFIEAIKNIHKCIVAEKLDGTALTFGLDDDNEFYTTRSGKGSTDRMYYKAGDWGISGASNGFKAAHAALKKHVDTIRQVMKAGEAMDIEILFGRQPNTIVYGLDGFNYIAFLKATPGTNKDLPTRQANVKKLYNKLKDKTSDVRTINVDTTDGESLTQGPTVTNWKFTTPEFIKASHFEDTDVKKELASLEEFLKKKNKGMSDLLRKDVTNFEAATMPLSGIKTSYRSEAKGIKDAINGKITNGYKLPIKQQLLDKFIKTVKPRLQDRDVEPDEDLGMEGVVVLDPKSLKQFKIVDKDLFTTLNRFNYEVRNNIRGVVKSDDDDAPLNLRGGLLGNAKIRIARLFDMPGLAKGYTTKKTIAKFKGDSPESTVQNIVDSLPDADYMAFKEKIKSIIDYTKDELQDTLNNFKENYSEYKVKLENGKTVGYTKEIVRRTLLVFAETKKSIERMEEKIDNCESMGDIVTAMFGRQIKQLFGDEPDAGDDSITENMFGEDDDSLIEDDGAAAGGAGGGSGGTSAGAVGATTSGAVANFQKPMFKNKMIKRINKTSVKIKKLKKINTELTQIEINPWK